jgi:hypothetical protein
MRIDSVRDGVLLDTDVEEWMSDLQFTEVFNFAIEPAGEPEMEITRVLDALLYEVVYGTGIDEVINRIKSQPSKLIKHRRARKGEQQLNTAMGNSVDSIFKTVVERELGGGLLAGHSGLTVTPCGTAGPDVYMRGSPMVAWDVTTRGSAREHIVRDNFGRGWNRYYLLIWDEPGIGFRNGWHVRRLTRHL